jgi:outer membrane protein OmpA-like peptidoglycan-associated protein
MTVATATGLSVASNGFVVASAGQTPAQQADSRVTIDFAPRSARLSSFARAELDDVAARMKQDPSLRARLAGNAKSDERDGQRLAGARALSAKTYLVSHQGIDPSRITDAGEKPSMQARSVVVTLSRQ